MSQPDEPARPGLRERKKAKTRAVIQSEALRLFREQGYDATTVGEICEGAEVSESTFFRYFPNKAEVVLWDAYDPLLIQAFRDQPSKLTPLQAFRNAFRAAYGQLPADEEAEQRQRMALILSVPELRAAMLAELTRNLRLLGDLLAERSGRNPDDFAVRILAGAIVGVMIAVMVEATDNPDADLLELVDQALAHLGTALRDDGGL